MSNDPPDVEEVHSALEEFDLDDDQASAVTDDVVEKYLDRAPPRVPHEQRVQKVAEAIVEEELEASVNEDPVPQVSPPPTDGVTQPDTTIRLSDLGTSKRILGEAIRIEAWVLDTFEVDAAQIEERALVTDGTGSTMVTVWADGPVEGLEAGHPFELDAVTVDDYQNTWTLNLTDCSEVTKLDHADAPDVDMDPYQEVAEGAVVGFNEEMGIIKRCQNTLDDGTVCNRVLNEDDDECRNCGEAEQFDYDLRTIAVLDTGARTVDVYLNAELTQQVTGVSFEDAMEMTDSAYDDRAMTEIISLILGEYLQVAGTFRPERGDLYADDVEFVATPTTKELSRLRDALPETYDAAEEADREAIQQITADPRTRPSLLTATFPDGDVTREPARRVFPFEVAAVSDTYKIGDDETATRYATIPTGHRTSRVLTMGVLDDLEVNETSGGFDYYRGSIIGAAGSEVNIDGGGRYGIGHEQLEGVRLQNQETDESLLVAVVGKLRVEDEGTVEDGMEYESDPEPKISAEFIAVVDPAVMDCWVRDAAIRFIERLQAYNPEAGQPRGGSDAADRHGTDLTEFVNNTKKALDVTIAEIEDADDDQPADEAGDSSKSADVEASGEPAE